MPQPAKSTAYTGLLEAYRTARTARAMSDLFEEHARLTAKYVHACSRGHEVIQIAAGRLLQPQDYVSCYYRDDSLLLSMGMTPEDLMLQLFAKKDDPFSGGRTYYSHPSLNRPGQPKIPHQSSATGMQAIPAAGCAMGLQYMGQMDLESHAVRDGKAAGVKAVESSKGISLCSIGDAAMTEGEVAEAFHMTALRQLPMVWLVQDNEWDISAHSSEVRFGDATTFAKAFPGIEVLSVDGTDWDACTEAMEHAIGTARKEQRPFMVHASVPLLGHHTSGVRREFYRDDLEEATKRDPLPKLEAAVLASGMDQAELNLLNAEIDAAVQEAFDAAQAAEEPRIEDLLPHRHAPAAVTEECGERHAPDGEMTLMVDCALHAMQEIMEDHPEALLYGQDVGARLGGVFREAATLGQKFGDHRVFNTPIQEAFIIGSTLGMSATGCKPMVEVQFADYLWPGLNQLFTELSRSYMLSNGQWPVHSLIRVPIGAYGSGGPYHSSSIESVLANIRGVKVAYPSNGADLKGLLKASFEDPNPVVMLEHKGLYWSKISGTESAKVIEPDRDYRVPLGKARTVIAADNALVDAHSTATIVTYGRGVHWAQEAAQAFPGRIELLDLRTIQPVDYDAIEASIARTNRCLVLTEEPVAHSFAQALAGHIAARCFRDLDAAPEVIGSMDLPAIPLNEHLEAAVLPSAEKVKAALASLLNV